MQDHRRGKTTATAPYDRMDDEGHRQHWPAVPLRLAVLEEILPEAKAARCQPAALLPRWKPVK